MSTTRTAPTRRPAPRPDRRRRGGAAAAGPEDQLSLGGLPGPEAPTWPHATPRAQDEPSAAAVAAFAAAVAPVAPAGADVLPSAAPGATEQVASFAERLRAEAAVVAAPTTSPTAASVGGGPTLDELLVGAWEGLSAHRTVSCPVCSGAMVPRSTTGREAGAGHCGDCGTELR